MALVASLSAATAEYRSVQHKLDLIESGRLRPGTRVHLTPAELNAYARETLPGVTGGVRNPELKLLRPGVAQATALVDFGAIRRSQGNPPGWIMSHLLDGERPVTVTAGIRSDGGQATVDIQSVQVSGVAISGGTLDFLIQHFLLPLYPDAAVGRPFELGDNIERIEVQPTGVDVVIGR